MFPLPPVIGPGCGGLTPGQWDYQTGAAVYPTGALAHLQLGRACILTGDTAKARTAYQDFRALWKDADPDIPILITAKAEYAKLDSGFTISAGPAACNE